MDDEKILQKDEESSIAEADDLVDKKLCLFCGKMIDADSRVCTYCGKHQDSSSITIINQQTRVIQKTSSFSVISFVFSLVGIVLFPMLLEILAFVFGILGIVQCTSQSDVYNGKAFVVIGLVISSLYLIVLLCIMRWLVFK